MSSKKREVFKFKIRDDLTDWFDKLINEKYEGSINLCYPLEDAHFNLYTWVEISGSQSQLDDAVEFIRETSQKCCYKMSWLSENTYYVKGDQQKEQVKLNLNAILNDNDKFDTSGYGSFGKMLFVFNFRSDVIYKKKKEIENIFKSVAQREQQFIILPSKLKVVQYRSFSNTSTNILTAFKGNFFKYLSLEDILSLELAIKVQDSCYDVVLDHDIQMYLKTNWPQFYTGKKNVDFNAIGFKISKVLRYFIQKYHNCIANCSNPVVLSGSEIQSLSQTYKIEMGWDKLIHIDFKTTHEAHFCVVYHPDTVLRPYLNYDPKHATENHTIFFNDDNSLDQSVEATKKFSVIRVTSQNNCSPQQTKSMLQWVTRHFRPLQYVSGLILSKLDLNQISIENLNDLISMSHINICFYKMNFNLKTLSAIAQFNRGQILFINCQIPAENEDIISNISVRNLIWFEGMNIELNIFNALTGANMKFSYCRLVSSNWKIPVNKINGGIISFEYNKFDILTLLRFLNMLQGDIQILFKFCEITECNISDMRYFADRSTIIFERMSININTVFQILEYCEFQKGISFNNCHFYFKNNSSFIFSLKPVNFIMFRKINFDAFTLITILATLHNESRVDLVDCTILPLDINVDISNKCIKLRRILFEECGLETSTLFSILEISKDTAFIIKSCRLSNLAEGGQIDFESIHKMQINIEFYDMELEPRFVRSLLQTNSKFIFDNCGLSFMENEFSGIPIACKAVVFRNNTFDLPFHISFDLSEHLKSLADFTCKSGINFENCHFLSFTTPDVKLKPYYIIFQRITFDMEKLLTILKNISEGTKIFFIECIFLDINRMSSKQLKEIRKIKSLSIKSLYFKDMRLENNTILCLLKKCLCLEALYFINCKIESNPNDVLYVVLNCENVLVNLECLFFVDMTYSPNLLQILQYLNETCIVTYIGKLSNNETIEFCTKTNVKGERLRLSVGLCMKTIYFELFAELVRPTALNFKFDPNEEYDIPMHLLPFIIDNESQHDWSVMKIKYAAVNNATVKIEFIRNGRPIDLFFETNDLIDDSDEFIVDYS